jgi:uncharacterized SAM-binding protein YcdF (DUF218 family)
LHFLASLSKILLLPPGCLLVLAVAGLATLRRWPVVGRSLLASSLILLYALSTPVCSGLLRHSLEKYPAVATADRLEVAQAIVVLGADEYAAAREYEERDTVGSISLERIRYAAWLHRATGGVPLLTSGGKLRSSGTPVGETMAEALREEFGVPVRWVEDASTNTYENTKFSAEILRGAGVNKIFLVTSASHMRRSVATFEALGFEVIPAPTNLPRPIRPVLGDFLPRASSLRYSSQALYEWIGLVWYHLAYI